MRSRARSSRHQSPLVAFVTLATLGSLVLGGLSPVPAAASRIAVAGVEAAPDAAPLPPGFQETVAFSGLAFPSAIRFAADGRVFVAQKNGRIQVFDSLSDPTPTTFSDLLTNVHDFWDRGLLGLALDPSLTGGAGNGSYVYVLYAYNHILGEVGPAPWGDTCPGPTAVPPGPGATTDGCVVSSRLSRFTVSGTTISGPEDVLITDWCQQFPSHSAGTLAFGPDGALYVSGGDGASFGGVDYGQRGGTQPTSGPPWFTDRNPCDDPPGGIGGSMSAPTAEGGALRSQDLLTSGDPVTLDGSVLRVDPNTGAGMAGNPYASNPDANAKRIIAYGLRNPFRMTFRPGTNELWVGDVGWSSWEDLHRITNATDGVAENFGWPCYEGAGHQSQYDALNLDMCEDLYDAGPGAVAAPYFSYQHGQPVTSDTCSESAGSSTSGLAFYPEAGGSFGAGYAGGLFFADHSRDCIWFMPKGANGLPDPAQRKVFRDPANITDEVNPVDLAIGPGGDLFYVAHEDGEVRRISSTGTNQAPVAEIDATPTSGSTPLHVEFDASDSFDPDGGPLTYAWDLDGDGSYDDSTAVAPDWDYDDAGPVTVRLRVTDASFGTATDTQVINVANDLPVPVIATPTEGFTWHVNELLSFSGSATDEQDGTLPASRLSWKLVINHCPSACHPHVILTLDDVFSGSFAAPDHEYPSSLELTLTATDNFGASASVTRVFQPETVNLSFATIPSGLMLTLNGASSTAPFPRTVIVGSSNSVSAPAPQSMGGTGYTFASWSDGLAQSHDIDAPGSPTTYTATYEATLPGFFTFAPTADAQVRSTQPGKSFGHYSTLRVRVSRARTYLKFVVTGLSGPPSDAKLRLWVTNSSTRGGKVYKVGSSWTESGIKWSNMPAVSGSSLSRVVNPSAGTWVEFDLGSAITGNGTYSFALKGGVTNDVEYSSREGSMDPVLVVTP